MTFNLTRLRSRGLSISSRLGIPALALASLTTGLHSAVADPVPAHGVVAANLDVAVNSLDNVANSVTVTTPTQIGDFRIRDGSNNGDYNVQIGEDVSDDVTNGVLITSVRQNGRDNLHLLWPGTNFVTAHSGHSDSSQQLGFWIPVCLTYPNSVATSVIEYDMNVAAGWFPYDRWVAGYAHYSQPASMNNTTLDAFLGSPDLALGTHFVDLGNASYKLDLTSLGIDSRTDGILLVLGAKNEDNYALSQVNANDGSWTIWSKDNGTDATSGERDPIAFVFVPKTNTTVISGRFLGNGTLDAFSGNAPRFSISVLEPGRWELKPLGVSPSHGVLLVSPEGGSDGNRDNIVSYELNAAGDGWIVESRDLPALQQPDFSWLCPLETPGDGTEPVASFAFILGATPGFSVTPTNNLQTTEAGATATFEVVLDAQPSAEVSVVLSSSNPAEGSVFPESLTFTPENWNVPQTVTLTGQDDSTEDGPASYTIVLATAASADLNYSGINPPDVSVINSDNETGVRVTPIGGLQTSEAGDSAVLSIQLNTQPSADVEIQLSSSDPGEAAVSPSTVVFTAANWQTPQTVTVTGVDDAVDDGDVAFAIVTSAAVSTDPGYNGKDPLDVAGVNADNDTAAILIDPQVLDIVEGSTATFTVVLGSEPSAEVVVKVTSGRPASAVSQPAELTFNSQNWSAPQTVSVSAVDDFSGAGDISLSITGSVISPDPQYGALDPADVAVVVRDNEATLVIPSQGVFYGTGMPAIGFATLAQLSDPYTSNYNGGLVRVVLLQNHSASDRLEIRSSPGDSGIKTLGNVVSYDGVAIGSFAGGTGMTPLVLTLNQAANPTNVQALLRALTFRTEQASSPPETRRIQITVEDADGGLGSATNSVRVGLVRVAEFQQGVDHGYGLYTNAADIELTQLSPDLSHPAGHNGNGLWIDAQTPGGVDACQALLRFNSILGTEPGQIPTNAVIVYAELILTVPADVSNAQGDASPLHRMLVPWSAEFDTFNSVGNGFEGYVPNGVQARAEYDSFLGLANGDAHTGTGTFGIAVTPDVQAWVNRQEPNYGWLLPGWPGRLDGTVISASESPVEDHRPRLRVLWVPEGTAVASFRHGVNDYTGTVDTRVRKETPDDPGSSLTGMFIDWSGSTDQVLIRFDDSVGSGPGQIPPGATVHAAMLDLASMIGNAMGDGGTFHPMLKPWDAAATWNSLEDGITADGVEASETPTVAAGSAALNPNAQAAFHSFEMTSDVQAWSSGVRPNYGWVGLPWPNGGDGWGFGSSRQTEERNRPQLRVFYTASTVVPAPEMLNPVWSESGVQVRFKGMPGQSYGVERAPQPAGPWTIIGTVQPAQNGTGIMTDNTPLSGAGYYRVFRVQ